MDGFGWFGMVGRSFVMDVNGVYGTIFLFKFPLNIAFGESVRPKEISGIFKPTNSSSRLCTYSIQNIF